MLEQNGIPVLAIIVETLIGIFMAILASQGFRRYKEKRSKIAGYLSLIFLTFALAALISGIGKYLDFFSPVSREVRSFTDFTIAVAYCLLTLGNIFFSILLLEMYLDEKNQLPYLLVIANSIVIGLILGNTSLQLGVYEKILFYLIIFILLTLIIHGIFIKHSFRESRTADDPITQIGFSLIGWFSLLVIFVLILFIADLVVGIVQDTGFTIFYYLGWITVGLATFVGFLGYLMPEWFKKLIEK